MRVSTRNKKAAKRPQQEGTVERRKFMHLDTVFPVQIQLLSEGDAGRRSSTLQGFAKNVSREGLCLDINGLPPGWETVLFSEGVSVLGLSIELPGAKEPISAFGKVVWIKKVDEARKKYKMGICYVDISKKSKRRIYAYAKLTKWRPWILGALIGAFVVAFLGTAVYVAETLFKKAQESPDKLDEMIGQFEEKHRELLDLVEKNKTAFGTRQPGGRDYRLFTSSEYAVEVIDSHNVGGKFAKVERVSIREGRFECIIINTAPLHGEFPSIDFEVTIFYYDSRLHADVVTESVVIPIPNRVKGSFTIEPPQKISSLRTITDVRLEIRQFLP